MHGRGYKNTVSDTRIVKKAKTHVLKPTVTSYMTGKFPLSDWTH